MKSFVSKEYGYDITPPNPCLVNARLRDKRIELFTVGKWRPIRYYPYENKIPSRNIMKQVEHSLILNTGGVKSPYYNRVVTFVWEDKAPAN